MHFILKIILLLIPTAVFAGQPTPWQTSFQNPVTPLAKEAISTHNFIMVQMFGVLGFVTLLLVYVVYRFRASKNRTPSTVSHNTLIEIVWIAIPIIMLITIAIPSIKLIFKQETIPKTEMTLKVIGRQWYWSYEYPDQGDLYFDSYMVKTEDLEEGQPRLLEVDNEVVLPINTNITIQIASSDVIHSWAVPALGIKMDAVPGRLNEIWTYIEEPGIYYGQCSELCGPYHAFMPVKIRAVTKEEYKKWAKEAKLEFSALDLPSPQVAMFNN